MDTEEGMTTVDCSAVVRVWPVAGVVLKNGMLGRMAGELDWLTTGVGLETAKVVFEADEPRAEDEETLPTGVLLVNVEIVIVIVVGKKVAVVKEVVVLVLRDDDAEPAFVEELKKSWG